MKVQRCPHCLSTMQLHFAEYLHHVNVCEANPENSTRYYYHYHAEAEDGSAATGIVTTKEMVITKKAYESLLDTIKEVSGKEIICIKSLSFLHEV